MGLTCGLLLLLLKPLRGHMAPLGPSSSCAQRFSHALVWTVSTGEATDLLPCILASHEFTWQAVGMEHSGWAVFRFCCGA